MAKMRIHKKKWSKKLNKRELIQACYAMAKGNHTLHPDFRKGYGRDYISGGVPVL